MRVENAFLFAIFFSLKIKVWPSNSGNIQVPPMVQSVVFKILSTSDWKMRWLIVVCGVQ